MKVVIDMFCEWTNQSSASGSARTAWPRAGPCEERHVYAYTRPMHMYKMLYDKCLRTYIIYKTIGGVAQNGGLPPKKHSCFLYFPLNNLSSYWGYPHLHPTTQEHCALLDCLVDLRLLRPETFSASMHRWGRYGICEEDVRNHGFV